MRSDSQELLDFVHHCGWVGSQLMAVYDHHLSERERKRERDVGTVRERERWGSG